MNTRMKILGLGIGFMAMAFTISGDAHAMNMHNKEHRDRDFDRDHFGFGVGIGGGQRGHFEDRTETVLVPGYTERRLVPAEYQTEVQSDGTTIQRKIRDAYYEDYSAPERYETRTTRVWVEDRSPRINLGLGFHF